MYHNSGNEILPFEAPLILGSIEKYVDTYNIPKWSFTIKKCVLALIKQEMTLTSNGLKWDTRNLLENINREESKLGLSTFEILENYNYTHKWNYINYMKSEFLVNILKWFMEFE